MKTFMHIGVIALLLSGCGGETSQTENMPSQGSEQIEASAATPPVPPVIVSREMAMSLEGYDQGLATYSKVEIGDSVTDVYNKTRIYLFGDTTDHSRANMTYREHTFENPTLVVNVYGADNLKDDSVKALELKAVFHHDGANTFSLVSYGARQKCWRAKDKEAWTLKLCP
ncbi:MAG: hypothetical protein COA43_01955 [Robiginitomaculum sp.]|nr:MAG: hypothetical protein COA43_01955 [Robiginitomaculum sp.]